MRLQVFLLIVTIGLGAFAAEHGFPEHKTASEIYQSSQTMKPKILWTFTSGDSKVQTPTSGNVVGEKNILYQIYKKSMPEYVHNTLIATVPRIEVELKSQNLVCFPGSSEAEKRKEFSYLTPQYIQPPPFLVTRKEIADRLQKKYKNGVYLKDILKDKSLIGLAGESRSFGSNIDRILDAEPGNMSRAVFDAFGANVMQMIEKHRADYTIEYPFIMNDLKDSNKIGNEVVAVPLVDAGPFMIQYLACSKTPSGLAVVQKADQAIRENIHRTDYWQGIIDSVPKNQKPAFQKQINKYVQDRAKEVILIK